MNIAKVSLFVLLSLPLARLGQQIAVELHTPGAALGADPGEAVVRFLGEWTLILLLATLCVSSIARLSARSRLVVLRRTVGLFAFAYSCLHLLAYAGFLAGFSWSELVGDFTLRPYIMVGMAAFAMLLPLAVTSTRNWQLRLGGNWRRLHRLIYPAALFGVVHLAWLTKDGYGEVAAYGAVLALLFAERAYSWRTRQAPVGA